MGKMSELIYKVLLIRYNIMDNETSGGRDAYGIGI